MGEARTPELATPAGDGAYQHFDAGSVYVSNRTGAHEVHGAIREAFARSGWEAGPLGYPLTDETPTPDGRGRFNHFERGSVYWTAATGAHEVHGAIRERWRALGWERGPLGYPVTDESTTPDGRGRYNHFEGGDPSGDGSASVYWTAATGAQAVLGDVREVWAASGWETGPLGYPVTGEVRTPDGRGRFTHFERGSVYASATTAATPVLSPVREAWAAAGWETGPLGYPVAPARPAGPDEVRQEFQRGSARLTVSTGAVVLVPA
nr:hypothetical protein [Kineococcus siccus]